jgi:hypothetical protein
MPPFHIPNPCENRRNPRGNPRLGLSHGDIAPTSYDLTPTFSDFAPTFSDFWSRNVDFLRLFILSLGFRNV